MGNWLDFYIFICGICLSAASACHDGDRIVIDGSCSSYLECEKGHMVKKDCSTLHLFDQETLQCKWKWNVSCKNKSKECEEGELYPHPDSCKLYYKCIGGRLNEQFCPLLEVFKSSKGKCSFGFGCDKTQCVASESRAVEGDCGSYEVCSKGLWRYQSCLFGYTYDPSSQKCLFGFCKQCMKGDRTPGTACNTFQYCEKGMWLDDHCGPLRRYDPSKKSCVWWFQYTCPTTTNLLATTDCEPGTTRALDDCSKYNVCSQDRTWAGQTCPPGYLFDVDQQNCVLGKNARCKYCADDHADPESCSSYYTCELGKMVKKSCPKFEKWDGVTKRCLFSGAHCFPGDTCTDGTRATSDCKVYEQCIGGHYYKETCGFSRVFDTTKHSCVWVTPWHTCNKLYTTPECVDGDTKILSCDKYVKCENGIWNIKSCGEGQTFLNGVCKHQQCTLTVKGCSKYVVNGVEIDCVPGEVFDENRKECVIGTCRREIMGLVGDCDDGMRRGVEGSCKKFEECQNGNWVEITCRDDMNYNPPIRACSYEEEYPCNDSTEITTKPTIPTKATEKPSETTDEPTEPTESSTEPIVSPTTPTGLSDCSHEGERQAEQGSCTKYKECQNGKWVDHSCRANMNYNPQISACSHDYPCPDPSGTPADPTEGSTTTAGPPTQTEPPTTTTTPKPSCNKGDKQSVVGNCKKYLECHNGQWEEKSCWWPWKFDSVKLECILMNAKCAK